MDDVLKSFTAWNPDSSTLYAVGYTTGIPDISTSTLVSSIDGFGKSPLKKSYGQTEPSLISLSPPHKPQCMRERIVPEECGLHQAAHVSGQLCEATL